MSPSPRRWNPAAPVPLDGRTSGIRPSAAQAVSFANIFDCRNDRFCSGHVILAGRAFVIGGNSGQPYVDLFDPLIELWNTPGPPADMNWDRWYPTATVLGDGKVLAFSGKLGGQHGSQFATTPELYDPANNTWTALTAAQRTQELYPYMFLLPDGNLVDAGPGECRILISSNWTWGTQPIINATWWSTDPEPAPPGEHGSAVMYEPGKIMKCGGNQPGTATTWVVDLNGANPNSPPSWLYAGSMAHARQDHNLVVLPDGKVLALGGGTAGQTGPPVFVAEMFDPASGQWTTLAASHQDHPRMYHSTAMLLPDGRVVSAGGDDTPTAQIFRPPYVTSGAPRPTILSAPSYMQYGQQYTVTYDHNAGIEAVSKACLIRLAAVTHGFDQDQRYVPLVIVNSSSGTPPSIRVVAPAHGNIAPPGCYMLFILTEYAKNEFAPCTMAAYVQVGP